MKRGGGASLRGTWLNVCARGVRSCKRIPQPPQAGRRRGKKLTGAILGSAELQSSISDSTCKSGGRLENRPREVPFGRQSGEKWQAIRPVPVTLLVGGEEALGKLICDRQGTHAPGPRMSADAGSWEGPFRSPRTNGPGSKASSVTCVAARLG